MGAHGNVVTAEEFQHALGSSFQLDAGSSQVQKPAGVIVGRLGILVAHVGHVGHYVGVGGAPAHRSHEDEHFGHAHVAGGLIAQHGVGEAVAYQNLVDACGLRHLGEGEIVGGDHGNFFTLGFLFGYVFGVEHSFRISCSHWRE